MPLVDDTPNSPNEGALTNNDDLGASLEVIAFTSDFGSAGLSKVNGGAKVVGGSTGFVVPLKLNSCDAEVGTSAGFAGAPKPKDCETGVEDSEDLAGVPGLNGWLLGCSASSGEARVGVVAWTATVAGVPPRGEGAGSVEVVPNTDFDPSVAMLAP